MEAPELFEKFTKFLSETYREELEGVIKSSYNNFIDKEAEAANFIITRFIEFCEANEIKDISRTTLGVFGSWYEYIMKEINQNRTH